MISSSVFMRKMNYPIVSNHYKPAACHTGVCSCTSAPGCEVATFSNTLVSYVMWCKPLSWVHAAMLSSQVWFAFHLVFE